MKNALLIASPHLQTSVYGGGRMDQIAQRTRLTVVTPEEWKENRPDFRDVEVIFTTWGMPYTSPEYLAQLSHLKVLFYAAGSVQGFVRPFLERGVTVVSGWHGNAIPVAEFSLAQIILSLKGYWRNLRDYENDPGSFRTAFRGPGIYRETVALIGAGAVGRKLIDLLQPLGVKIIVFDPFLSYEDAALLGVEKVGLEDAFARGMAVSNHLADNPGTEGMLTGDLFRRMRDGATFLNTGRGRTVRENELAQVFAERPDLTALLDVTFPEPRPADSPLRALPNVQVSTHIAGATGTEVQLLGDLCLEEFDRYERGEPLRYTVTPAMLEHMA